MGRRALRKIDPTLDLSWHFLQPDQLPETWTAPLLFAGREAWELEIGSGKGLFLAQAAGHSPDTGFLGIEISRKYARFAAARLAQAQLPNARIVHGDAVELLTTRVPGAQLQAVHIYFPDPWWKKRHHKRRIMSASFVQQIERVLRPGGRLEFWTDVAEYYALAREQVRSHTRLAGPVELPETAGDNPFDYRTHFERRMRLHDKPVYRSRFLKAST